jgi:hypothetical protein
MGARVFLFSIIVAAVWVQASVAEEVLKNTSFETGELAPWTAEKFGIMYGGHSGRYHAGIFTHAEQSISARLRQNLGRTIYPQEIEKVALWAYGGTISKEGEHGNAEIAVHLGPNNRHDQYLFFYYYPWEYVEFPFLGVNESFDYIYIRLWIPSNRGATARGGVDDVSIRLRPTFVEATSFGRIKALYR